jgi:protocatechuate 3,4-dioxygenase beta subunit
MNISTIRKLIIITACSLFTSCNGQSNNNAEKDEAENGFYGIAKPSSAADTSAAWKDSGQKILLTGTVYQPDGKTPAPGVLLYYYQTNTAGRYIHKPEEIRSMPPNAQGQTHGYIRGWIKTGSDGKYYIYTARPGTYPTHDAPAHIHVTVKEPGNVDEYYLDDFVFDDDPFLKTAERKKLQNRGGSGILRLVNKNGLQVGERNIYLGLYIPGYIKTTAGVLQSGRNVGEDVFSFIPYHAWGPDKGTRTCPVCKYGWYHGILYCVGNNPNWPDIKKWLAFLEAESRQRLKYLKVYFVYGNKKGYSKAAREKELKKIGTELQLEKLALTFVPSFADTGSEIDALAINQHVDNTILIYKRCKIVEKFINLESGTQHFNLIRQSLDKSVNEYFDLPGK